MFQIRHSLFPRMGVTLATVLAATFFAVPAGAQPKPQNIPGVSYNVSTSLADNLKAFIGKKCT